MNIVVVYWSSSGNTKEMAEFIAQGAMEQKAQVYIIKLGIASKKDILNADRVALGFPSMDAAPAITENFHSFLDSIAPFLQGKPVALFGSYEFADFSWMEKIADKVKAAGGVLVDEPLLFEGNVGIDDAEMFKKLGEKLAR